MAPNFMPREVPWGDVTHHLPTEFILPWRTRSFSFVSSFITFRKTLSTKWQIGITSIAQAFWSTSLVLALDTHIQYKGKFRNFKIHSSSLNPFIKILSNFQKGSKGRSKGRCYQATSMFVALEISYVKISIKSNDNK